MKSQFDQDLEMVQKLDELVDQLNKQIYEAARFGLRVEVETLTIGDVFVEYPRLKIDAYRLIEK